MVEIKPDDLEHTPHSLADDSVLPLQSQRKNLIKIVHLQALKMLLRLFGKLTNINKMTVCSVCAPTACTFNLKPCHFFKIAQLWQDFGFPAILANVTPTPSAIGIHIHGTQLPNRCLRFNHLQINAF